MNNTKDLLIQKAIHVIEEEIIEEYLRELMRKYIQYKFNESIGFSLLTDIHYNIFRIEKDEQSKVNLMTMIELIILAGDIMDDMQDKDATNTPWYDNESMNLNVIIYPLSLLLNDLRSIVIKCPKNTTYLL